MNRNALSATVFAIGAAPIASAQLHAGDILVSLNAAQTRLLTGQVDGTSGEPVYNVRVFSGVFGEAPNFTNDPGFDSEAGSLPANSDVGFTIRRAVRVWDGSGFATIPTERIRVKLGPLGPVDSPLTDDPVVGFGMGVNGDGEYHHHPGYTLLAPAADGVYLYEAELWSSAPGVEASRPFWIVFNQNRPAGEHEAAVAWAEDNLVGCPSDFDQNQFVNGDDFDSFAAAFEAGDIEADFDMNGFVNGDDFDGFVAAFAAGC